MSDGGTDAGRGKPARPRRSGLGRGLDSLIPTTTTPGEGDSQLPPGPLREVAVDEIVPNPYQPRTKLDREQLQDLADSIRQHGLMQPLVVTANRTSGGWTLIAGERRWRAARHAGLDRVPVVVMDVGPRAMLELAIVENVVRADLSPLEEASAFHQLIDKFGLSQSEVAERVGRSRASVANTLRLLGAPGRVQDALAAGEITEGHARALLGLPSMADQIAALALVIDKGLNVRQTEALVRGWGSRATDRPEVPAADRHPDEVRIEDKLRSALGTRVSLRKGTAGKGGTLTIQFFSDEQLQGIYDRLVGEELW